MTMRMTRFLWAVILIGGSAAALSAGLAVDTLWPDWRWHDEPLHSAIEALGGVAAVAMGLVLLHRRRAHIAAGKVGFLAAGFLAMGILDFFHAAAAPGNGFVLLRNVAALAGSIGFAFAWLPDREAKRWEAAWIPWGVSAAALGFGIWAMAFPEQIPEMMRNGEFTPTAVAPQSLACLFFLTSAFRFFLDTRSGGRSDDGLLASLALLFGLAEFVFMYSIPWDASWWFWHLLRLIACLVVLGYLSLGYLRMIDDLTQSLSHTKQAEENLRQASDERERMAQDLHDGVIQSIFAIGLGLERGQRLASTDTKESSRQLGSAIADLKLVIRDLRGYLVGLEPPISNGRELEAALSSLVRSMQSSHRLSFLVQVSPEAADRVSPEQAAHLLSIAREAMSNSLRHSAARAGALSLQLQDGYVRLTVEDDGVGFDADTMRPHGHGLKNIEARARRLGAHLAVTSEPGRGTRVVCDLPQEPVHAPA